jgi:uridine kinase
VFDLRAAIDAIERLRHERTPIIVAIDGGSGAGKSTIAASLAREVHAVVVSQDDFYSAHISDEGWEARSIAARVSDVIDWQRVRGVLVALRSRQRATWRLIDFEAGVRPDGTYSMSDQFASREPSDVILLDGAYSASPAVEDLVDLTVLIDVPLGERHRRLDRREDAAFLRDWHARWDPVEAYYFTHVRPRASFDIVISPS